MFLEHLPSHFAQGVAVRDQLELEPRVGGVQLPGQFLEVGAGARLAVLESHGEIPEHGASLRHQAVEFNRHLAADFFKLLQGLHEMLVVPLDAPGEELTLETNGEIELAVRAAQELAKSLADRVELPGDAEDPLLEF